MRTSRSIFVLFTFFIGILLIGAAAVSVQAQVTLGSNWSGSYYSDADFTTLELTRVDPAINWSYGMGAPVEVPAGFPTDNFSIRWIGTQNFPESGIYRFRLTRDEDAQVMFNGQIIFPFQGGLGEFTYSVDLDVTAGDYPVEVSYKEGTGDAFVQFYWQRLPIGETPTPGAVEEQIRNGGFEGKLVGDDLGDLTSWQVKNSTGDLVRCNREDKVISNTGDCAFRFKGNAGEQSRLSQSIPLFGADFQPDTSVMLKAQVNANKVPDGDAKVVIVYGDDTPPTKLTANFVQSTADYALLEVSGEVVAAPPKRVKVMFNNRATSGKVLIDDVSLRFNILNPTITPDVNITSTPTSNVILLP